MHRKVELAMRLQQGDNSSKIEQKSKKGGYQAVSSDVEEGVKGTLEEQAIVENAER